MKIYFIQQGNNGPIKIGVSWEIKKRLRDISVTSPFDPVVLALIPGNYEKEKKLHRKFKKEHLRGEWFKPSDIEKWIQGIEGESIAVTKFPTGGESGQSKGLKFMKKMPSPQRHRRYGYGSIRNFLIRP